MSISLFSLSFSETHYAGNTAHKLTATLLPQCSDYWDYGHESPHPTLCTCSKRSMCQNVYKFTQSPICGGDNYSALLGASDSKLYLLKIKISLLMYQLSSFFLPLFSFHWNLLGSLQSFGSAPANIRSEPQSLNPRWPQFSVLDVFFYWICTFFYNSKVYHKS